MAIERHGLTVIGGQDAAASFAPLTDSSSRSTARTFLDAIHPSIGKEFGLSRQVEGDGHPMAIVAKWLIAASREGSPLESQEITPLKGSDRAVDFASQRRRLQTMFPMDGDDIVFYLGHYTTPTGKEGYTISAHRLYQGPEFVYAGDMVASEKVERMPGGEWHSRRPSFEFEGRHQIEWIAAQQANWARGYQVVVHSGPQWKYPDGEPMPIGERAA